MKQIHVAPVMAEIVHARIDLQKGSPYLTFSITSAVTRQEKLSRFNTRPACTSKEALGAKHRAWILRLGTRCAASGRRTTPRHATRPYRLGVKFDQIRIAFLVGLFQPLGSLLLVASPAA